MKVIRFLYDKVICNRLLCMCAILVLTMLSISPLLQPYFGWLNKFTFVWVVFFLAKDLFTRRYVLRSRYFPLLILFLGSYFITIVLFRNAHLATNLTQWAYMFIYFFFLYVSDFDKSVIEKEKEFFLLSDVAVVATLAMTVVCWVLFLFSINYVYQTPYGYLTTGFASNRFWGLYNPNAGTALAGFSFLAAWMLFLSHRGHLPRAVYIVNMVLQVLYIMITLSRTALYALLALSAALTGLLLYRVFRGRNVRRALSLACCVLICGAGSVTLYFTHTDISKGIGYLPSVIQTIGGKREPGSKMESVVLDRVEDFQDEKDASNGRTDIWAAGFKAYTKSPAFGIPAENMPDFVNQYLTEDRQKNVNNGGLHNIYLTVLVCSGAMGFLILGAFLVLNMRDNLFRQKLCLKKESLWRWGLLGIILFFLIIELTEARIVFNYNFLSILFWTYLGYGTWFSLKDYQEKKSADTGVSFLARWIKPSSSSMRKTAE